MFIKEARCRTIKNSRKEKTVEVILKTYRGKFTASAPSGKSKGKNEIPDYNSRGIIWSVKLANNFLKSFSGKNYILKNFDDIKKIEDKINNYEKDFGKLGGNLVYAIETAFLKSAAKENKKELWEFVDGNKKNKIPMPVGNCIGGGLHSKYVNGKKPDFQEFLLIPDEKTFSRAFTKNINAYFYAKKIIKKKYKKFILRRNDEGAWNVNFSNEEALDILREVANKYGLRIGLDVASSEFCDAKKYYQYKNKLLVRDRLEQIDYMRIIANKYNIFYMEDPLEEEDFSGFKELSSAVKKNMLIVGDDLTTTNFKRLERAVRANAINAIIVKPNQIGSLVEVKKVMDFCKKNKITTIFSHRSGETMDSALADYAVGFGADFIKSGIYGKERLIKLKRIMEIEKRMRK